MFVQFVVAVAMVGIPADAIEQTPLYGGRLVAAVLQELQISELRIICSSDLKTDMVASAPARPYEFTAQAILPEGE